VAFLACLSVETTEEAPGFSSLCVSPGFPDFRSLVQLLPSTPAKISRFFSLRLTRFLILVGGSFVSFLLSTASHPRGICYLTDEYAIFPADGIS